MTNLNTPELQGALDCLAMLLLQPEAENAVQAIPFAAEALLILGKDTLPQDSQEALTSIAEKPTVEPVELQKAYGAAVSGNRRSDDSIVRERLDFGRHAASVSKAAGRMPHALRSRRAFDHR